MTTSTPESRGRIAYTAYGKRTDFKNYLGKPLPPWDELPRNIQKSWIAAAGAIWELATTGRTVF